MKSIRILVLLLSVAAVACNNEGNRKAGTGDIVNPATPDNPKSTKNGPLGTPTFDKTVHDFGKITDGEEVQHKFKFKNTGKGNLTISNVQASCGCTTPEWTKEIIAPGGEGYVMATFNSNGKGGPDGPRVEKSIAVTFVNSSIENIDLIFVSNIFTKDTEKK
jgi:Protein of unknown function (DUF1573)